jgi:hypothetical protein
VSKKIRLFSVALVVFVVVLMAFAGSALASYNMSTHTVDHSAVITSPHNVTPGSGNPCDSCHIPHSAKGAFLFARTPGTGAASQVTGNDDTGVTTAIKPLCYSCHDGTIASLGVSTVFSTTHSNHRTRSAAALTSSGTAYGPGRDCDLCHDPHDDGNTKFLKYERYSSRSSTWSTITGGGNFCASCHSGNVDPASGGAATNSMNHRTNLVPSTASTPTDKIWAPAAGDYSGTRLFDPTSHLVSTDPTAQVNCGTCHTPHGADPDATAEMTSGTPPVVTVYHSLNTMATSASQLCLNCHK